MREADPTTLIWTKSFVCLKHVNSDTTRAHRAPIGGNAMCVLHRRAIVTPLRPFAHVSP